MRTLLAALIVAFAAVPAAAQLPAPGSTYHLLFATSNQMRTTTSQAIPPVALRFGSIAGGDYLVTQAAANASLPGTLAWDGVSAIYHAILSVSGDNAATRLSISGPIYNMSSQLVATGKADLFDATPLAAAVGYDEFGQAIVANTGAWTGTDAPGTWSGNSCGTWNSTASGLLGRLGSTDATTSAWTSNGVNRNCNLTARLYGLSPAMVAPLWGDYDGSGTVDGGDFLQWQQQLGQAPSAMFAAAKAFTTSSVPSGLYEVNAADLAVWQTYFGQSLPPSTSAPEPRAWLLALVGLVVIAKRPRGVVMARTSGPTFLQGIL